jgi:hypothetical protein
LAERPEKSCKTKNVVAALRCVAAGLWRKTKEIAAGSKRLEEKNYEVKEKTRLLLNGDASMTSPNPLGNKRIILKMSDGYYSRKNNLSVYQPCDGLELVRFVCCWLWWLHAGINSGDSLGHEEFK